MKLYIYDYDWRGSTIVMANTQEEADIVVAKTSYNGNLGCLKMVFDVPTEPTIIWENLGDT